MSRSADHSQLISISFKIAMSDANDTNENEGDQSPIPVSTLNFKTPSRSDTSKLPGNADGILQKSAQMSQLFPSSRRFDYRHPLTQHTQAWGDPPGRGDGCTAFCAT